MTTKMMKRVAIKKQVIDQFEDYFMMVKRKQAYRRSSHTQLTCQYYSGFGACLTLKTKQGIIRLNVYGSGQTELHYYDILAREDHVLMEAMDDETYSQEDVTTIIQKGLSLVKRWLNDEEDS